MSYERFLQDLHAVRDHAGRFRRRADQDPERPALTLALEELDVTLEELRVAEEEVRTRQEALEGERAQRELERERYQVLFHLAPAPYLVTDPAGVIRQANLRALGLLGVDGRFAPGKPLASFVDPEDRPRFRDLLSRLPGTGHAETRVLLRPRGRHRVQVVASVAVGRDRAGVARELRWLLWPPALDVDAFGRGEPVWTPDLRSDPRWPRLGPAGAGNHIRGVLSVPVGTPGQRLGTVNAMTRRPRAWTDADVAAAGALVTVSGRLLGSVTEARHRGDLVVQLQGALDSRILIEQAKGVLMEREGLSAQAAFERLRRQARARSRKLDDVAREVIAGRSLPAV